MTEAQARCDSNEFSEWLAYQKIEPFGGEVDDFRYALFMSAFCNAHRSHTARKVEVKSFLMGDHEQAPMNKHQRWAAIKAKLQAAKDMANGKRR